MARGDGRRDSTDKYRTRSTRAGASFRPISATASRCGVPRDLALVSRVPSRAQSRWCCVVSRANRRVRDTRTRPRHAHLRRRRAQGYVVAKLISLSSDEESFKVNKLFINKMNKVRCDRHSCERVRRRASERPRRGGGRACDSVRAARGSSARSPDALARACVGARTGRAPWAVAAWNDARRALSPALSSRATATRRPRVSPHIQTTRIQTTRSTFSIFDSNLRFR